jgi:hypothetical protein
MVSPCKGCERRTVRPNCHGTCGSYKKYVAERELIRNRREKEGKIISAIREGFERVRGKKENER